MTIKEIADKCNDYLRIVSVDVQMPGRLAFEPRAVLTDSGVIATVMKINFNALPSTQVRFIEPMYALVVQKLPEGKEWLYEVKFDGYRCLAGRDTSGVTLWSRRGNVFTKQFRHIAEACERLPANTLVDGEIVALDQSGRISFNLLQHHRSKAQALLFYVFDVLIYRGRSLFKEPLEHRRQVLAEAVNIGTGQGRTAPVVALSESLDASPKDLIRVAKEFGFEGIVAKRKDSLYESGKRTGGKLTEGRSLLSVATHPVIRSMPSSSAITRANVSCAPPR